MQKRFFYYLACCLLLAACANDGNTDPRTDDKLDTANNTNSAADTTLYQRDSIRK
ncbi:MAG TPA: hypothetical protein VD993_13320 [Chitinophagaceae bacterium]|nr:hypothetical protein [Chitinophagaceae bacterium]